MARIDQLKALGGIAIVTCVLIMLPQKLPTYLTNDNIGVLNMKLRYYIFLALLIYITVSHLESL